MAGWIEVGRTIGAKGIWFHYSIIKMYFKVIKKYILENENLN